MLVRFLVGSRSNEAGPDALSSQFGPHVWGIGLTNCEVASGRINLHGGGRLFAQDRIVGASLGDANTDRLP